jgi:hypothetical protein
LLLLLFLPCLNCLLFFHVLLKGCLFASLFVVSKFQFALLLLELLLHSLQVNLLLNFVLFTLAKLSLYHFLISIVFLLDLLLFQRQFLFFLFDPLFLAFLLPHKLCLLDFHLLLILLDILLQFLLSFLLYFLIFGLFTLLNFLESSVPVYSSCISCCKLVVRACSGSEFRNARFLNICPCLVELQIHVHALIFLSVLFNDLFLHS